MPALGFSIGIRNIIWCWVILVLIGIWFSIKIDLYYYPVCAILLSLLEFILDRGNLRNNNVTNAYTDETINLSKNLLNEEKNRIEIQRRREMLVPENYIKKFLQHAERNYGKMDKYGNQNKDSLEKEIADYLVMIAKQVGNKQDISSTEAYKNGRNFPTLSDDYRWLMEYLRLEFQKFHQAKEQKIKSGELIDISSMSWIEFEKYLAQIFKKHWYIIEMTPETGDQWADIIAEKDGRKIIVQAKRYTGSVGNGAIQEVIWAIKYYDWTEWWVITNSIFTNSARELARVNHITLIDGTSLENIQDLI